MTDVSFPRLNPADSRTLSGAVANAIRDEMMNMHNMLPAQVIAYDRASNRASVQPLINMVDTANQTIVRNQVVSVPVLQLGAGGFFLSFPVNSGDLGWIKANDRDISLFKQSYTQSPPNTQRIHDFADSMFIPDCMFNGTTIAGANAGNAVLQSTDGTTCIALGGGKITITAPTSVTIDTPLLTITGQVVAGTNPSYTQTASFNGNIITTGDVIASGTSLHTHVHGGVQTGSGDTGAPV